MKHKRGPEIGFELSDFDIVRIQSIMHIRTHESIDIHAYITTYIKNT